MGLRPKPTNSGSATAYGLFSETGARSDGGEVRSSSGRVDRRPGGPGTGVDGRDGDAGSRNHSSDDSRQRQRLRAASRSLPGGHLPLWPASASRRLVRVTRDAAAS